MDPIVLDGPIGTELLARGVATPLPGWSAHALESAPDVVRAIHRDYAEAGANVHTANTFRTQPRWFPDTWRDLVETAVKLAREGLAGYPTQLAGSIAPLEDCYSPELSPPNAREEHRALAEELADAGVDILLVETFPRVDEGLIAAEEAVRTGLPTWLSFTAGPEGDLLTPAHVRAGAEQAVSLGVEAVLVNCIPTNRAIDFVAALSGIGVAFGAYANAGKSDAQMGFRPTPDEVEMYADAAELWTAAGATILGGCCGTGVGHIRAIRRRIDRR